MKCRFKVDGRFDGEPSATVTIDRASGIISVRPCRRRRTYDLPLARVAAWLIEKIALAEANEKRKAKGGKR